MKEVETKDFRITFPDGSSEDWINTDEKKFLWMVGNSGEFVILRKLLHTTFANTVLREDRVVVYANGTWSKVETLDDKDKTTDAK